MICKYLNSECKFDKWADICNSCNQITPEEIKNQSMTKDEMMEKYYINSSENNYKEAKKRIQEAMEKGEKYVLLPGKCCASDFTWVATSETINKLREDGFDIDVVWDPFEYWSVEWGY